MRLIGRRLLEMVLILAALSFALFGLLSAMPGDPVDLLITSNPTVKPEDVVRLKKLRGLDKPWTTRYLRWLWGHHEPISPPRLPPLPPLHVELDDDGRAEIEASLASLPPALHVQGLFGAHVDGEALVASVEGTGRHRLWFIAHEDPRLVAVGSVDVLAAEPPPPIALDVTEERHLAGGTEDPSVEPRTAAQIREGALHGAARLLVVASAPQVVDDPDTFRVDLAAMIEKPGSPPLSTPRPGPPGAHEPTRAPDLSGATFRLLPLPGSSAVPGVVDGREYSARFESPGQTAIVLEATLGEERALGAFAVEHGPVPDPERFTRGFLFAFLGEREALGFSNTYKRPVWELLFGPEVVCGDFIKSPGEGCDDGNTTSGDGCSATCHEDAASFWDRLDILASGVLLGSGRVLNTLSLMLPALLLSFLIAIPIGVLAAVRQYSWLDYLVNFLAFVGISTPVFWLGIMAMALFAEHLNWLPAGGIQTPGIQGSFFDILVDRLRYTAMPALVLSLAYTGRWLRYMRASMLEVLPLDFVRTARAKGLSERVVILKHALKNALIPVITVLALSSPALFGGAVLTEWVFSWPGIGRLQFDAVMGNDYYVAIVVFLVSAALVMLANLTADILYVVVDPRLRRSGR